MTSCSSQGEDQWTVQASLLRLQFVQRLLFHSGFVEFCLMSLCVFLKKNKPNKKKTPLSTKQLFIYLNACKVAFCIFASAKQTNWTRNIVCWRWRSGQVRRCAHNESPMKAFSSQPLWKLDAIWGCYTRWFSDEPIFQNVCGKMLE